MTNYVTTCLSDKYFDALESQRKTEGKSRSEYLRDLIESHPKLQVKPKFP